MLDNSSGTTGRARVALTGAPDTGVPASVFVKLAPFDELQREFVTAVGMGVAEARFYRDIAPEIPMRIPNVWYSQTEGDGYVMVLEDLVANGCRFPHPKDHDIAWRALDIVEQMAALHGRFWESPRFDQGGDLAWLARKGTGAAGGGATFVQMAVDAVGDQLPEEFHRLADIYLARTDDIVALWNSGPRTLVHGDPHMGNLFVDPAIVDPRPAAGDRTGFLDWAMIGRSPGLRDVAYVLCNSVPAAVRSARGAGVAPAVLRTVRARTASTSTRTRRGINTACSPCIRGCPRRRPRAWARSGSRCTSGSAAPGGRPRRATNSVASICSSICSAELDARTRRRAGSSCPAIG